MPTKRTVLGALLVLLALAWTAGQVPAVAEPVQVRPVIVYINRQDDECYHVKGCSRLREGFAPVSLQNAKSQGFKPCPECKPPQ